MLATWRLKPAGWAVIPAVAATVAFNLATSAMLLASIPPCQLLVCCAGSRTPQWNGQAEPAASPPIRGAKRIDTTVSIFWSRTRKAP